MRKTFMLLLFSTFFIASGILTAFISYKPEIEVAATYPDLNLTELSGKADYIIHGVVDSKSKTKKVRIPVTTELNVDDSQDGHYLEDVLTEVKIKVIDPLKSKEQITYVTYNEEGGELEGVIYLPDGGLLKKGEEVLIFMNKDGFAWGAQSILKIHGEEAFNQKDHKFYNLNELKAAIRKEL